MNAGQMKNTNDSLVDNESGNEQGGVQSVETGVRVLAALIDLGPAGKLKDIADLAGMPPPKAHRYLVSYCRSGMAERVPGTGGYKLGMLAMQLGFAALRQQDIVSVAAPFLTELRDECGYSAGLAVWGTYGPTIVRFEDTTDSVIISVRAGSVLPVLTSATGRVFGAFLPRSLTDVFIRDELAKKSRTSAAVAKAGKGEIGMTSVEMESLFDGVRAHGLAFVEGDLNRGIHALSAPVFDHAGKLAGAMSMLGAAGLFDVSREGPIALALRAKAREVSRALGAP